MDLIVKIGGSIQKDENDYKLIVDKIRELHKKYNRIVVVTSAIKNVTNELLNITVNTEISGDIVTEIYERHVKLLSKFTDGKEFENAFKGLSKLSDELFRIAWSIRVLDEVTPRVRDYVLSFGERMATILLSSILRSNGIEAEGIPYPILITDSNYGEANVIEDLSRKETLNVISNVKSNVIVIPGFIGKTIDGRYTTLGRGGSDYTATLFGKLLGMNEVRLITEVPGIMTGDPKKFPNAKTIPRLSLEEAIELSQLGAKRLHPRTFDPLFDTSIKVFVESLYEDGFTIIDGKCDSNDGLKGISLLDNLKLITVESTKIVGKIGSAAKITTEAKETGVNIISISQPASETTIQLAVDSTSASRLLNRLEELKGSLVKNVEVKDIDVVGIIGCGIRKKEISTKVLSIAAKYDPLSISRGISNVSLTFIVNKGEGDRLSKELHEVIVNG
ncbi:aspartate kinase [Sulfolobus sp. B1]|uniref:aspartate kinase n=1 Tax=Sulfolobus sp. B1 TaxID=2200888 RepID=UPI00117C71A8|nr:aspartate kinase [Sulfolobus sp. B1]TRM97993.1 aspartate kinase [Sulfolobus sp. B1]